MARRSLTGRLIAGMGPVGVGLLALGLSVSLGCSKKKQEDAKAQAEKAAAEQRNRPEGDRYADGQRLTAALKDWTRRWADTSELPTCDALLKSASDGELCKAAEAALIAMKTAAAKPEPEAMLVHAAAELALATEAASEKLRSASMEKLERERKAEPAGSASATPGRAVPRVASSASKARPLGSAAKAELMGKAAALDTSPLDPMMQVIQAYSRVNRASLRYLSQFLQFGSLPTRKGAFTELEALSKRRPTWPALGRTLREAAMAENNPDLQGQLKALAPSLSRRAPSVLPGGAAALAPSNPEPGQAAPPAAPAPAKQ